MDTDSNKVTWVVIIVAAVAIMGGLFVKFVPNIDSQMQTYVQAVIGNFSGKSSDSGNLSGTVDSSSNSDFSYSAPNKADDTISIVDYSGHAENLIVPRYRKIGSVYYKITAIGVGVFEGNTSIKYVTIPDSVTSIKDNAFAGTDLTSVNIPDSVTSIGKDAFENTPLTSVDIPAGLTSIDNGTFSGTKLTSVNIPDSVTSIGKDAFENTPLTSVHFPASLTSIGSFVFANTKLTSVDLPAGLISIGDYAFANTKLTSVNFPAGLTSIGGSAFVNTPISAMSFKKPVNLDSRSFRGTNLKNVTLPTGSTYNTDFDAYNQTFDPNVKVTFN